MLEVADANMLKVLCYFLTVTKATVGVLKGQQRSQRADTSQSGDMQKRIYM